MSLEEIRARAEKATPGPWEEAYPNSRVIEAHDGQVVVDSFNDGIGAGVIEQVDADFIAHARTDVPKLVAALEAIDKLCVEIDTRSGYDVNASVNVEDVRGIITKALS